VSSQVLKEFRKRPRLPVSFPLFARGVDHQGRHFKELLTALNVSASGMLALAASKFVPPLYLQIDLPIGVVDHDARQKHKEVRAQVVRTEQRARGKLVGLKFYRPIA
jgi:c-di-GMP-binding flagellar brake protein YcgR